MNLIERWRSYVGPVDERVEAESNRIYKKAFLMLTFGILVIFYYDGMVKQVEAVRDAAVSGSGVIEYDMFELLVFGWFMVTMVTCACLQCRKGFADDNRFAEVDEFPFGYYALVSGLVAGTVGLISLLMRILAEVQVLGLGAIDGNSWIVGAVIGASIAVLLFCGLMLGFYVSFRAAKSRRKTLEDRFDD